MAGADRQPTALGQVVRRRRRELGITTHLLAECIGCNRSYISLLEGGFPTAKTHRERRPGDRFLARLAGALGWTRKRLDKEVREERGRVDQ